MALFGIPRKLHQAGPLTATAIGVMSALGAGLGWTTHLGALLRSTTAAGVTSATAGVGTPARELASQSMVRRSLGFSAEASASDLASVSESAGSRWDMANRSIPGITGDMGM
jgi:hypothetical protein